MFVNSYLFCCLQELDEKVNELFRVASELKNNIKKEQYLNDIINLFKGHVEKVKHKKLPFKLFHEENSEPDLII